MELKTSEQLDALLELLLTRGVEEFQGLGFHVKFSPAVYSAAVPDTVVQVDTPREPDPRSAWEDPSLWPTGRAPRFPEK